MTYNLTDDEKGKLTDLALDCAFDGNGPPNREAADALIGYVEALVQKIAEQAVKTEEEATGA